MREEAFGAAILRVARGVSEKGGAPFGGETLTGQRIRRSTFAKNKNRATRFRNRATIGIL